jgi:predicted alpha/beta hydrolase family esterase
MAFHGDRVRVLVVPGLHDSGPTHWQSRLQAHFRHAVRVQQHDWATPDLTAWAERIEVTLAAQPPARWVAVAHSFGCLALLRHLATRHPDSHRHHGVQSALLVAPADPDKFGIAPLLPPHRLGLDTVLIASETDPWMAYPDVSRWARTWGSQLINLGDAGHINVASGFGPLPLATSVAQQLIHRAERERRIDRAHPMEWSFAV